MYNIKVEGNFSAAHNLRGYKGKCEELHGHNWKVEAVLESKKLDKLGMAMDFRELKERLNDVLERLDHKYLNDVDYFRKVNPTSENIAKYIYDSLKPHDPRYRVGAPRLKSVTVWENDNASATYCE